MNGNKKKQYMVAGKIGNSNLLAAMFTDDGKLAAFADSANAEMFAANLRSELAPTARITVVEYEVL